MEELNIEIPQDVKDFIKEVQSKTKDYQVFLVGGYLRDKYKSLTPKDLDLALIPHKSVEGTGRKAPCPPAGCYINYNKSSDEINANSDMTSRGVSQLVGLYNNSLSTREVQFIVYDKYLCMTDLAKDMDMNIVQVMYNSKQDICFATDAFISGHENKVINCLQEYDEERTWHRYNRMEVKFPSYEVIGKPDFTPEKKKRASGTSARHAGSIDLGED